MAASARTRFARLGHDAWRARAEALVVAADVGLDRKAPALVSHAALLAEQMRAQGLGAEAMSTSLNRARVLIRRGALDDARSELAGLGRADRHQLAVRLLERDVRAELAGRTGRRSAALGHVRSGLDDLHAWQSSFGSLDLQTNVVGHGVRLAVRGLTLAVQSRSDAVLFEWSERARMLASRIQPVRAPQDPQTAADLAELRAEPAPEREAELRRRIRERAWQRKGSGEVADPVALAELQAGLGEDTALVAYVVTAERVVALVVTSAGTARHDLGERSRLDAALGGMLPDLDMAASDLPDPLAGSVRGTLARRLDAVAALLVDPLLDADLGERRLVLTPSGLLAGVPWTLLPGLVGRPVTVAPERHLVAGPFGRRRCAPGRRASWPGPASYARRRRCGPPRRPGPRPPSSQATTPRRPPSPSSPAGSTSCTSPPTAGTRPRTRCSPASSSSTARGSATTSTSSPPYPTSCCSRPARSAAPRSAGARS